MAVAIRSIARATCGSAAFTAAATSASSALMMLAISREDFWSRFLAARLGCSVGRWLNLARGFFVTRLKRFVSVVRFSRFHKMVLSTEVLSLAEAIDLLSDIHGRSSA